MDNDAASYRRFLAGDDSGLCDLVRSHKDGLMLYLFGYVGDLHIAEELTEDTFFRLITKRPRFSGKSSFKTWLYAVGRNAAVDYIRHNSRLALTFDGALPDGEVQSLEQTYIRQEQQATLRRALARLSPDYRQALWLIYFEGFTSREAAVILRKNDRQMKNLLYRARQSLREILERDGFVYEDL